MFVGVRKVNDTKGTGTCSRCGRNTLFYGDFFELFFGHTDRYWDKITP